MSFNSLGADLLARKEANLYRQRRTLSSPQIPSVIVEGREYTAFCSNDYLGLANHPALLDALKTGADRYGVGGGASHLVIGHSSAHHALEEALAEFTGRPRALLFSTGYMANLGAVNGLLGKQDAVFEDRLNHASLLDAGILSGARFQRYLHNDAKSLEKKLSQSSARRKLVVTDGVFSMDGDVAPLPELSRVTKANDAWLMVDDAHGFGCLGLGGRGLVSQQSMSMDDVQVLVGTFGKAFGTSGAFVAGSEDLIETLIQHARTYIYTTSMSPAIACATLASLKIIEEEQWRRDKLNQLIQQFRQGCIAAGLDLMASDTPIQPVMVGDAGKAMAISESLAAKGMFVTAIRPPTVPAGSARLRVTLTAEHSSEQVALLVEAMAETFSNYAAQDRDD